MKSLSEYLEDHFIEVGELIVRPLNEFQVWIEDQTGEGVAVEKKMLEGHLLRCVQEHYKK